MKWAALQSTNAYVKINLFISKASLDSFQLKQPHKVAVKIS